MANSELLPDIRIKNWRIYLDLFPYLATIAIVISTLSTLRNNLNFRSLILFVLVKIIAYSGLYCTWRSAAWLLSRRRDRSVLNIWQIMSVGFIGGSVFTICEDASFWLFQIERSSPFYIQFISYALPAAFWLPAGSVISKNYRRYLRVKKDLQEELLQQEEVGLVRARVLEEYRAGLETQIQESLRVTTQQATSLFESLKDREVADLPYYLRTISNEYFRLTAHEMVGDLPAKNLWRLKLVNGIKQLLGSVKESIKTRPLNPLWFTTIVSVTIIPNILQRNTLVIGIEIFVIVFVTTYLVQRIQLRIVELYKVDLIYSFFITSIVNVAIPMLILSFLPARHIQNSNFISFIFTIGSISVLGHLAQSGLLQKEEINLQRFFIDLEKVRKEETEANLIFAGITRSWAKHIHGSYTSKLESSAIALENAVTRGDFEEVGEIISEVGKFLSEEKLNHPTSQKMLLDEIDERCENWAGIIEFEIISNILLENVVGVSVQQIGNCIEEAILNASRHGGCSWIGIEIVNTETLFQIFIKDDGKGFTNHTHGFGSSIFSEATNGQWDIWRDDSRQLTVLQLKFRKIP